MRYGPPANRLKRPGWRRIRMTYAFNPVSKRTRRTIQVHISYDLS
jgi:hypothetical protein